MEGNYYIVGKNIEMIQRTEISKDEVKASILAMQETAKQYPGAEKLMNDYIRRIIDAPASTDPKYGNAIDSGFIDERFRIFTIASKLATARNIDADLSNNIFRSLAFLCWFGDIGLLGIHPYTPYYVDSEAWMKKRNQLFQINPEHPSMTPSDISLYLLQKYSIQLTTVEFLGVKLSGGMHLQENNHYATAYRGSSLLDGYDGIVRIYFLAKELAKQDERNLCKNSKT